MLDYEKTNEKQSIKKITKQKHIKYNPTDNNRIYTDLTFIS